MSELGTRPGAELSAYRELWQSPEVPKHSLKQRPTPPLTWVSLRWTFQARPSEVCGLPGTVPWRTGGHMGGVVPGCGGSSWPCVCPDLCLHQPSGGFQHPH